MTERPILFKAEMVRAILEGRKTQTRRIVKWEKLHKQAGLPFPTKCRLAHFGIIKNWALDASDGVMREVAPPFGDKGDQLWVRETFAEWIGEGTIYRATASRTEVALADDASTQEGIRFKWKPSIFMPRNKSRIDLRITNVRVERLQDLSRDDAVAEGVEYIDKGWKHYGCDQRRKSSPLQSFQTLWNSINGNWDPNPWVWVYEFERIRP